MKHWLQSPDEIPERHQLKYFLNMTPNVKLPLSKEMFSAIPIVGPFNIDPTERDKYFVERKSVSCTLFFTQLITSLMHPPVTGRTKDSFHSFWDAIISKSLQIFGSYSNELPLMNIDRNTSRSTTTGQNRPDFILLMRNICVVRGEEKGENGKGEPARELIDKFNTWDYGDIPYLFGYYANTAAVTFCVLYNNEQENNSSRKRKHPNICRILPMIINMCPSKEMPDFEIIVRDNGTNIEIGYGIKKIFPSEDNVKHLENFYGIMSNYKIKCIDKLVRSRNNVVHLKPRGKEQKPKNLNELLRALICILTCLEGLHNIKPNPVMHRDIRWPNIIQYDNQYILIDFDFASFSPSNENLQNLNSANHAPEMLIGEHDVTVDIWGVGNLIISSGINELPKELLSLFHSMCQKNKNIRPNASDTLKIIKGFFVKWFSNDDWLNHFENK
ncbi:317_t:CDS:2 [Funneliformis caledonium]|uniref:317_t:CDS:1 n=1 Tax=Funneliformis caledonium TaxID=1117310 RepID=A0A9N9EFK6_9GLOM|nr:317_t:CDS:2 [Funneliformis caledonium]